MPDAEDFARRILAITELDHAHVEGRCVICLLDREAREQSDEGGEHGS